MVNLEDLRNQKRTYLNLRSNINLVISYLSKSSDTLSNTPSISDSFQIDDVNKDNVLQDNIKSIQNAKNYFSTTVIAEINNKISKINNAITEEEARLAAEEAARKNNMI